MKKNIIYTILGAIAILFALYVLIHIFTTEPQIPIEYKNTIDSLTKVNNALIERQKKVDSIIYDYETKLIDIQFRINNIKEKTMIVKEYYHEVSRETQSYNTTQVDSFLRNRFNY
jgi:hypothetical protein